MSQSWKDTILWKKIKRKKKPSIEYNKKIKNKLEEMMEKICRILDKGGSSPLSFTLHDSGHSYRVAEYMMKVVPQKTQDILTIHELALLLLSAYLHDIGMSPEENKINGLKDFLQNRQSENLKSSEKERFHLWLDMNYPSYTAVEAVAEADEKKRKEIISYYCRSRHNDWSEEWIRKNLGQTNLGSYEEWLQDLIDICKSHHEGYEELRSERFNPVMTGEKGLQLHKRYLAAVLRVADILEASPERTPQDLFKHRDIPKSSEPHWKKDHGVTLKINEYSGQKEVKFKARPKNAKIHHLILQWKTDIEKELKLCAQLNAETFFDRFPGFKNKQDYKWNLSTSIFSDIEPFKKSYTYIEGNFRPDSQRILELLAGNELYKNPLAAVRELLHNAFDAVEEQIAYEKLSKSEPDSKDLDDNLRNLHEVSLIFQEKEGYSWIICKDDGSGMTKDIIENHLLRTGSCKRSDILTLERKCSENDILLDRTGKFGIGVLSYFLIADKVVIETCRSQDCGSSEDKGWRFETGGVGTFGELRKIEKNNSGTVVRLRLPKEKIDLINKKAKKYHFIENKSGKIIRDPEISWQEQVEIYVSEIFRKAPCQFKIKYYDMNDESIHLRPGWLFSKESFTEFILNPISPYNHENLEYHPEEILNNNTEDKQEYWKPFYETAKEHLNWKSTSGQIDNLCQYRLFLPYFDFNGNASLAFLNFKEKDGEFILEEIDGRNQFLIRRLDFYYCTGSAGNGQMQN